MFTPKKIAFRGPDPTEVEARAFEGALLALDLTDKMGNEYHDGDVVKTSWKIDKTCYPMLGYIRYFGGRFEIVCPWADQRFILGLNSTHEIVGNMMDDERYSKGGTALLEQMKNPFKKEGGFPA